MADIKPIETIYNGYKFRSRLEARYAVFFDELDINYQYELEGFDLGTLGCYLPDFWLEDHKVWVEIKPQMKTEDIAVDIAHEKARILRDGTGYPVIVCHGAPKEFPNYFYGFYKMNGIVKNTDNVLINSTFMDQYILTNFCVNGLEICDSSGRKLENILSLNNASELQHNDTDEILKCEFCQLVESGNGYSWNAARKARQARFGSDEKYGKRFFK